jgi:hypothetical protein
MNEESRPAGGLPIAHEHSRRPSGGAPGSSGTLRRARAEALYEHFAWGGASWLPLDGDSYASLRRAGLARADVEDALALLADERRVEFETRRGVVWLRMVERDEQAA